MEHSNWFLPVQPDRNERQPNMDPHARLLKLVIERIELKQKAPSFYVRSSPHCSSFGLYCTIRESFSEINSSSGDRLPLAWEIAALDALAIFQVMWRVDKNDNLREVFARAVRSIREALLLAGGSYEHAHSLVMTILDQLVASEPGSKQKYVDASESDSELEIAYTFHAFLTSVLHLLTSVFRYLIGYVDRGGSKTYSSGAFDFRDSFVALVLFQGAYVWIKFRQAAPPDCRKRKAPDVVDIEECNLKGVHKKSIKNSSGAFLRFKYEPRFTPPRPEGDDGTDPCSKRQLPLGEYHTPAEAQIVRQIARYYYDKDGGCVELKDGQCKFSIPPMSEQEQGLVGKEKRKWVTCTAKEVGKQMYADFQREKGKQLAMATEAGSHGAEFNDPSSSALSLPCPSLPMLTTMVDEPAIASAAPSSPSLPLLLVDGAIVGDANGSSEALSGYADMIDGLFCDSGSPNPPDQQLNVVSYQMQYQGFAPLLGGPSLPDVGAVPRGIEHDSEPELNPSPSFQQGRVLAVAGTENIDGSFFLPQSVPDLQQLLLCQKKCLEDYARQFVDLDHQLKASQIQNSRQQLEYQIQISKLQQEYQIQILKLQQEKESLKSRLEQVAKSQVSTWTGITIDVQQRD